LGFKRNSAAQDREVRKQVNRPFAVNLFCVSYLSDILCRHGLYLQVLCTWLGL
jgi:hypothetical protein